MEITWNFLTENRSIGVILITIGILMFITTRINVVKHKGFEARNKSQPIQNKYYKQILAALSALVLLLGLSFMVIPLGKNKHPKKNIPDPCKDVRLNSNSVLSKLQEIRKAKKYSDEDLLRFDFIEIQMKGYINSSNCDSLDQINDDIEGAKVFLKEYE